MTDAERERFDLLVQDAIESLPARMRALIDEVPIVVLDRPTPEMMKSLEAEGTVEAGADPAELCGLHTGTAITERSVEDPGGWGRPGADTFAPEEIHLFREGIVGLATDDAGWSSEHAEEDVYEEIRVTILHEVGHHFGLDEGDLDELGYG